MKHTLLTTTVLLAAAPAALAFPFTARPLPAGFNAAYFTGDSGALYNQYTQQPMAVDFLGTGTLQWYAGGTVITRYPEGGTTALPAITLSVVHRGTAGGRAV